MSASFDLRVPGNRAPVHSVGSGSFSTNSTRSNSHSPSLGYRVYEIGIKSITVLAIAAGAFLLLSGHFIYGACALGVALVALGLGRSRHQPVNQRPYTPVSRRAVVQAPVGRRPAVQVMPTEEHPTRKLQGEIYNAKETCLPRLMSELPEHGDRLVTGFFGVCKEVKDLDLDKLRKIKEFSAKNSKLHQNLQKTS